MDDQGYLIVNQGSESCAHVEQSDLIGLGLPIIVLSRDGERDWEPPRCPSHVVYAFEKGDLLGFTCLGAGSREIDESRISGTDG